MKRRRPAGLFAVLALVSLVGGCVLASMLPRLEIVLVAAGFAGYVLYGRKAMMLWRVDETVFIPRRMWVADPGAPSVVTRGLLMGAIGSATLGEGPGRTVRPLRLNADGARRVGESSRRDDEVRSTLRFPSRASRTKSFDDV
jgi:hypothetical protein